MVLGETSQWNGLLMHVVNFVDQLFSTVYRPDDSVRRGSVRRGSVNSHSGWLPGYTGTTHLPFPSTRCTTIESLCYVELLYVPMLLSCYLPLSILFNAQSCSAVFSMSYCICVVYVLYMFARGFYNFACISVHVTNKGSLHTCSFCDSMSTHQNKQKTLTEVYFIFFVLQAPPALFYI